MLQQPAERNRLDVPGDAFVRKTGQLWKLIVAGVVLPVPGVIIGFLAFRSLASGGPEVLVLGAAAVLLVIDLVIAGLLASARCPECGSRLVFSVLRAQGGLEALAALLNRPDCPSCGSHGESAQDR